MSKVWLITGSGNGLGRDIAEAALAAGDNVVTGARRTEELAPLVAQYCERVKPVGPEVRDEAAAKAAMQLAVDFPCRKCYPSRMPLKSATTSATRANPATGCNNVTCPVAGEITIRQPQPRRGQRGQRDLRLTRRGRRARLSGERESQGGDSGWCLPGSKSKRKFPVSATGRIKCRCSSRRIEDETPWHH
jgi:hypothetical protein